MAKKKAASKNSGVVKARSKSEVFAAVADDTGLAKRDIAAVFSSLESQIKKDLGTRGPGVFSVPGLMKIQVRKKPATKAIKGWTNPFTGEKQDKPARPASKTVKIRPLKKLKEMV
ncbi:MAG: HU family DNA-binding protein [Phycisphaerales bacterium]|nr:HU family DNA-binding protein [Phycisphaerales bacterium]